MAAKESSLMCVLRGQLAGTLRFAAKTKGRPVSAILFHISHVIAELCSANSKQVPGRLESSYHNNVVSCFAADHQKHDNNSSPNYCNLRQFLDQMRGRSPDTEGKHSERIESFEMLRG
jgi:hypothetical protein